MHEHHRPRRQRRPRRRIDIGHRDRAARRRRARGPAGAAQRAPRPDAGRACSPWRRPACRSPSSRCAAASTTTSRRSRSCPATTSSAPSTAVGPGVDPALVGRRFAAVTKIGAGPATCCSTSPTWCRAGRGRPGRGRDRRGQRHHRLADAAPHRPGRAQGATVVVLGANGGVGTTLRAAGPARRCPGDRHRFAPPPRRRPRAGRDPGRLPRPAALGPDPRARPRRRGRRVRPRRRRRESSSRGGCWPAAARSSPTAPPPPGTMPGPPGCRCSSCSPGCWCGTLCPTAAATHFYNFWAGRRNRAAFRARLRRGPREGVRRCCGEGRDHGAGRRPPPAARRRRGDAAGRVRHGRRQGRPDPRPGHLLSSRSPAYRVPPRAAGPNEPGWLASARWAAQATRRPASCWPAGDLRGWGRRRPTWSGTVRPCSTGRRRCWPAPWTGRSSWSARRPRPLPRAARAGAGGRPIQCEGLGPMQGLAAGLAAVADRAPVAFVCSTDLPFLHPAFVRRVLRGFADPAVDVVLPVARGLPATACRRLSDRARRTDRQAARRGQPAPGDAVRPLHGRTSSTTPRCCADVELARHDPELDSVVNVNTPDEYASARGRPGPEVVVECFGALASERSARTAHGARRRRSGPPRPASDSRWTGTSSPP